MTSESGTGTPGAVDGQGAAPQQRAQVALARRGDGRRPRRRPAGRPGDPGPRRRSRTALRAGPYPRGVAREKDTSIPTGRIRRTAKVAGLAGGQTARNYATRAANLTRDEDGPPRGGHQAPGRGGRADPRGAGQHEGRGDEGGPGGLVHRHRRLPGGVPGADPGQAGRAARLGAQGLLQGHEEGDRVRAGREARRRLRRVRRGRAGRRVDRPGLQGQAARRPRRWP